MKAIKLILKLILKILKAWYWDIPIRFNILAFLGYFAIIYLVFGTIEVDGIESILKAYDISFFVAIVIPLGIPMFLSFGAMFPESPIGCSPNKSALQSVIKYRNGQMSITSDKNAAEIYAKTADLDVMNANSDSEIYKTAIRGFNATYGASNPTKVYNDMMKK